MFILMICLFDFTAEQRISQVYPLPTTVTPQTFSTPVTNGRYSQTGDAYIHYPYGPAGTNIRILQKDGTLLYDLSQTGSNVNDFILVGDNLYAFGSTNGIMHYMLTYTLPTYMTYSATFAASHNLNLLWTFLIPSTSLVLVTTSTGGNVHRFDTSNWVLPPSTVNIPFLTGGTVDAMDVLPADKVVCAGQNSGIAVFDKLTMASVQTFTGDAQIGRISYDTLSSNGKTYVDYVENAGFNLKRAEFGVSAMISTFSVGLPGSINNLLPFPHIGYLMITVGNSLSVFRRTSLTLVESFTLTGEFSTKSIALSGGSAPTHKYVISGALVQTTPVSQTIFSTYEINLNYCASFSGTTCSVCFAGYQANSTVGDNRCILPEEYPPFYGASGRTIAPCKDTNCAECIKNYEACTLCKAGTYLNPLNSTCQVITEPSTFGIDPLNPQKLKQCEDFSCLNCPNSYLVCKACPAEVFILANGVCVSKLSSIAVESIYFDKVNPAMVIRFSQAVDSRPDLLYPKELTFTVTDYKGDNYTYLEDTRFTMEEANRVLRVSFKLTASIYNSTISVTQLSDVPQFYNKKAYLSKGEEFVLKDVRLIQSKLYDTMYRWRDWLGLLLWALALIQTSVGVFGDPEKGTAIFRGSAILTILAFLNGPVLHVGDLFISIGAGFSVPFLPSNLLSGLAGTHAQNCYPGDNFNKHEIKVSCSILQNYGSSLVWFLMSTICSLVFSIYAYSRWRSHANKSIQDPKYRPAPGLAKVIVWERYIGAKFIVAVVLASMPTSLLYALVSLNSMSKFTADILASLAVLLVVAFLTLALLKFTVNFLDKQNLVLIKKAHIKQQEQGLNRPKESDLTLSNLTSLTGSQKGVSVKRPGQVGVADQGDGQINKRILISSLLGKNKVAPLPHEGMKRRLNKIQKLESANSGNAGFALDSSVANHSQGAGFAGNDVQDEPKEGLEQSLDNSSLPMQESRVPRPGMNPGAEEQIPTHTSIVNHTVFSFVGYSFLRYKSDPYRSYSPVYFIPVVELIKTILQCLAIVRFADRGMTQIYAVGIFELLVLGLYVFGRPLQSTFNYFTVLLEKIFVCSLFTIKLINFAEMREEEQRQQSVDIWFFAFSLMFLAYVVLLGFVEIVEGVGNLRKIPAEILEEDQYLQQECKQFAQIEDAIVDFTRKMMLPIGNSNFLQSEIEKAPDYFIKSEAEDLRDPEPFQEPQLAISHIETSNIKSAHEPKPSMRLMIEKQSFVPSIKISSTNGDQNIKHSTKLQVGSPMDGATPQPTSKSRQDTNMTGAKLRSEDGGSNYSRSQDNSEDEVKANGFQSDLKHQPNSQQYRGVNFLDVASSITKSKQPPKRAQFGSKLMKQFEEPQLANNNSVEEDNQPRVFAYKSRARNLQHVHLSQDPPN